MATPEQINDITALYVGYFNRAPDPAGLQFWIDQIDGGREFNTIAEDFAGSPEAQALYPYLVTPGVSTPTAFITSVYVNLFNRAPDADGLAFWTGVLADGSVSVADMIEAIINGAQDDAVAGTYDATTLNNKIEVGLDFAAQTGNTPGFVYDAAAAAAAVEVLNGVTEDPTTVDAGKLETQDFLNPPETFTLTTATDSGAAFVGSADDTTFNAALDLGIDGLVGVQTLQGSDVLDGGAGFNVLNAELNGTGTTANPTISNIQQYNLTSNNPFFAPSTLDLDRATGYEQLWNRDSRSNLTLENVGQVAILGMDNVRDGSTYRVNYDNIAVETQTVVVDRAGRPGDRVELEINGVQGQITNLALNVVNDIYLDLDNDAADIANLSIAGSGFVDLVGAGDFNQLESLDATGYNEDLTLDISGSGILTSVVTGEGNDLIIVGAASVDGDMAVNLGAGANTLAVDDVSDEFDVNGLDFTGGVENVQTLALLDDISLGGNATLDLDGFDDQLSTISVNDFEANGQAFTILTAPEVLEITAAEEFEMNGGLFTVEGVVNLTMASTGPAGADSDIRLDGGVNSTTLETLLIEGADDARLEISDGLAALQSIDMQAMGDDANLRVNVSTAGEISALEIVNVTAADDADARFVLTGTGNVDALTTVTVTSDGSADPLTPGNNDANLTMTGRAGVAAFAGTQATQSFTVNVTAGASSGIPFFARTAAGNAFFTSGDLGAGFVDTNYSTTLFGFSANNGLFDLWAASDIASALDATAELEATNTGNVVNVTWANIGSVDQLVYQSGASGATSGTLDSVTLGTFTQGQAATAQIDGEGFEAVETITVDAQDGDSNVNLTDVYGAFTLTVTASDNATVNLINTNVTSANVAAGTDAGDTATVTISGDMIGAQNLVDLTVSGDQAVVTLSDDLGSFEVLDVRGVASTLTADTSAAGFSVGAGEFIEYQIGATDTVAFTGNAIREVYNFSDGTFSDIGNVVINGFTAGADPLAGDRLDLSDYANGAGQLVFNQVGGDVVISDLAGGVGDFGGTITIVGATVADLSFNVIYA